MKNIVKMIAMIAAVFCVALAVPGSASAAEDAQTTRHYFTQTTSTQKINWFVEGEKVVAISQFGGRNLDYSKHYYEMKNDYTGLYFYRLKTDRSGIEKIPVYRDKVYTLQNGEWVLTYDGSESGYVSYSDLTYNTQYYDFTDSGIDILEFNMTDRGTVFNKGTMSMDYKSVNHSTEANIYSYLLNGTFTDFGKNYVLLLHENLLDIVPQMYRSYSSSITNSTVSISVDYDEENGVVSWSDFVVDEENTLKKGVIAAFYYSGDKGYNTDYYRTILTGTSYKISLGGCDFSDSTMRYSQITFIPYYIHTNGTLYFGKSSYITIDEDSVAATRSASSLLTQVKSSASSGGIVPSKGSSLSGDLEDATYDSSLPDISGLRYSELSSRDCHSVFDSWSGCFRLKWNSQNNSTDFYEIRAYGTVTYTNSSSYKTGRVTKTGVFSLVDPSEKCWVNRGKHDFCMHDLLDKWTENGSIADSDGNPILFKDIEKLYVRTWRVDGSTGAVSYGKWSIYDVDMGTGLTNLNEKSVAGGQIIDGDSDITDTGDVSGNVSSVIDPPISDEDVSISIGDIDLGNLSNIGNFFKTLVSSLFSVIGDFPNLFARIFCFLPQEIINMIYLSIIVCIIAGLIKIFV